jgi:prepilin-type N-terminal cleavage/methylation domain-containing protein
MKAEGHKADCRKGFTLAEVLVALVVTGLLLAAVAVAFDASVKGYRVNRDLYYAVSQARQALTRITTQVRSGMVDPNNAADTSQCRVLCADGSEVLYHYDSGTGRLYAQKGGQDYVLCEDVASMSFLKNDNTATGDVKSVRVKMTVVRGDVSRTVAGAAIVRRVLE